MRYRSKLFLITLLALVGTGSASAGVRPTRACELLLTEVVQRIGESVNESLGRRSEHLRLIQIAQSTARAPEHGLKSADSYGQLPLGQRLLVKTAALRTKFPQHRRELAPLKDPFVEVTVEGTALTRMRYTITIEVRPGLKIEMPHTVLRRLLATPDALPPTPFALGEYVQLGPVDGFTYLTQFGKTDRSGLFGFMPRESPRLVRIKGEHESGNLIVEYRTSEKNTPTVELLVPPSALSPLTVGSHSNLSAHLAHLRQIRPRFERGETVRYRDGQGLMQEGTFTKLLANNRTIELRDAKGSKLKVARESVFKHLGTDNPARTMKFAATFDWPEFNRPEGALLEFLDGAARLGSHPDFAALPMREKIVMLMQYVQRLVPWSKAGLEVEADGLANFGEVVCSGAGVCRHINALVALVLLEAGIEASLVHAQSGKSAHLWGEAHVAGEGGSTLHYIFDASRLAQDQVTAKDLMTFDEAALEAASRRKSSAAKWYTNRARKYLWPEKFRDGR